MRKWAKIPGSGAVRIEKNAPEWYVFPHALYRFTCTQPFVGRSDTPAALAALAAESGLAAVALTDHDTVGGVPEFLEAARAFPQLEAIAGVEISTAFSSRELHIVGLFVDHANPQLGEFLGEMRRNREIRNEAIRIKLNSLGYPLTWDHPALAAAATPLRSGARILRGR